jgi:hypothetical protein
MGKIAGNERRRAMRAPVRGLAVLHRDRGAVRGRLENLSLSGLLLRSRDRAEKTDSVDVELRLPTSARRIVLTGKVVRVEQTGDELAIAVHFDELPADAEDAIEDQVVDAFAAAQRRSVLVVEGHEEKRRGLADALRDRSMTPLMPRTPLEVIDLLSSPDRHVEVCLISSQFGDHHGREIANVIRESFPWVRIVFASDDDPFATAEGVQAAWDELSARVV